MFFSIVVPVYNVERYLAECLDSIVNQTEQDFEAVLVNDGSKDASGAICDEYVVKYPEKFSVYHQENKGALLSRRVGIEKAKGEFLLFIDSDDFISLDALEIIKKVILRYDCDLVMYNRNNYLKNGEIVQPAPVFDDGEIFEGDGKYRLYSAVLRGETPSLAVKAVKRSIIDIGIDYTQFKHIGNNMDFLQVLPIVTNSKKAIYINRHLYHARYNPFGVTKSFRPGKYKSIRAVAYELFKYMESWNLKDEEKDLNKRNLNAAISAIAQTIGAKDSIWGKKEKSEYLKEVSCDSFFRESFKKVERGSLSFLHRFYSWLLYNHKYTILLCIAKMDAFFGVRYTRLRLMQKTIAK